MSACRFSSSDVLCVHSTLIIDHASSCVVCRVLQALDGHEAEDLVYGVQRMHGHLSPKFWPTCALLSFKSAAQAGLKRRRLLVLFVLSAQPAPRLPAGVLQHICKLAELVL